MAFHQGPFRVLVRPRWSKSHARCFQPFCTRVIMTFLSYRVNGISQEEAEIALGWLDLATKPTSINRKEVPALSHSDRAGFIIMVRGWMAQARLRYRPSTIRPAAPLVPISLRRFDSAKSIDFSHFE